MPLLDLPLHALALLDASTGFHDIKPLPEFAIAIPWTWIALLAVAAVFYLAWRRRKPGTNTVSIELPPPKEEALDSLRDIKKHWQDAKLDQRSLGEKLSHTLRRYLERALRFPALELTSREVSSRFAKELKKQLSILPSDLHDELSGCLSDILRECDQLEFATSLAQPQRSEFTESLFLKCEEFIRTLNHRIEKENERTRSIIEQEQNTQKTRNTAGVS